MTDGPGSRFREFERILASRRGIRAARVVGGPQGVEAIKVLIVPERDPVDTVRTVQALALSHLDQPVERSRVRVLTEARDDRRRCKLASLVTERTDRGFTVRVLLELGGDALIGEARSPLVRSFEWRSVPEAILDGLAGAMDFPVRVESIDVLGIDDARAAIVALNMGARHVVGSALVRHDDHDAIARATLDGLNRFLSELPRPRAGG